MESQAVHEPVMVAEVLEHLEPARGGMFVDCTLGLGGHARALLEGGATQLLGLDRDPAAVAQAAATLRPFGKRVEVVHGDYRRFDELLDSRGIAAVDGVLADLGVSSMQLDAAGRGFSFKRDEPLDMRMDPTQGPTAQDAIRQADERKLAGVIAEFGEERYARRIARALVQGRARAPIETTTQLADIVRRAIGSALRRRSRGTPRRDKRYWRIDPATRTFQAIRIWVNRELEGLDVFLTQAARRLRPGGRMVVITFHSLEDRIVKHTFRALQTAGGVGLIIRTKRPVVPSEAEVERNPRARSAKLRAVERTRL